MIEELIKHKNHLAEIEQSLNNKFFELESKISLESKGVEQLSDKLTEAKIDLETDQRLLDQHKEMYRNEMGAYEQKENQLMAQIDKEKLRTKRHD